MIRKNLIFKRNMTKNKTLRIWWLGLKKKQNQTWVKLIEKEGMVWMEFQPVMLDEFEIKFDNFITKIFLPNK